MTEHPNEADRLLALDVDDVDGVEKLFAEKVALAKLKHSDVAGYEKLRAHWKRWGVPRLPQLDREVDALIKDAKKKRASQRTAGADGFERNQNGHIVSSPANIRTAFTKMGVILSYDSFRGWPLIEGLNGFGPTLDDASLDRLWLSLDEEFGFRPPQSLFNTVSSDACMQNRFHAVRDYLDGLKWDGKKRIDTWLIEYCHTKDTAYTRAVGAIILVAAVRRVRQPGAKFDEMLILESAEQGHSKSLMVETLAVRDDWYSDSVPMNADDKKMIESTSGKWICEVGELQGMRKGEVERIRGQLSRRSDRARLAYARLPVEVPRQNVLIGTTNADQNAPYLADVNGNRRFWPVEIHRCDVDAMRRDIDQIWAEAAAREATGVSIRLPEELWSLAAQEQAARSVGNAFEGTLAAALGDIEGVLFADDAWRLLNIPIERRDTYAGRFGKAFHVLGWVRSNRRRNGHQAWAYVKGDSGRRLAVVEQWGPGSSKEWVVRYHDVVMIEEGTEEAG